MERLGYREAMEKKLDYRPEHLAHLRERGHYCLDMLEPAAQEAALKNILATDRYYLGLMYQEAKSVLKSDLHAAINDPYFISRIRNRSAHVRRLGRDPEYLRRYVLGNLAEFSADGRYQPYRTIAINLYAAERSEPAPSTEGIEDEELPSIT